MGRIANGVNADNLYSRKEENVLDAPKTLRKKLRFLGPGFILSASIVGSGELIATTTLGARAGFVTFWIIMVSCIIKVAIQLEFGKHAILSGETAMTTFNKLPGPRLGKANWSIWTFFILMILKITQLGGIVGGAAITLHILGPAIDTIWWAFIAGFAASAIVFRGYYSTIERAALIMIGLFTVFTFISLYYVQFTPFAIQMSDIASGLTFQLPPEAVAVAIGAFGITGVGGDEIIHYTYWCTEKGYAKYVGPMTDTPSWRKRARGWISIMYLDALASMAVYTLVTAAFYLLGASILNATDDIPQGFAMIESLSNIYTETLGPQARWIFLIGALIILFSTLFSALAAWTRQYTDIFGQIGWLDYHNEHHRKRSISLLAWILPLLWVILFIFIKLPVAMVIAGGIMTSIILLLVVYAAIQIRYKRLLPEFKPSRFYDLALWLSIVVIIGVVIYSLVAIVN